MLKDAALTLWFNALYYLVKFYHWTMIQLRYCFRPNKMYVSTNYTIVYPDHIETHAIVPNDLPDGTIVVKNYTRHTLRGHLETRACILPNDPKDPFAPVQPPWWFIGANMDGGEEICVTDTISAYIVAGNVITPLFLNAINRDIEACHPTWFYIDPERFEEVVIPPEGITVHGLDPGQTEDELPHED
jgi:hypothetical protein